MRGVDFTLSRLPVARALIAGAAILAGAAAPRVHAQSYAGIDDTAMSIPRVAPRGGADVPFPQPLPPAEVARLRRVFALQRGGDVQAATREAADIDVSLEFNQVPVGRAMLGHLLADRYLGRFTKPGAEQLGAWLAAYPDLPDAPAIHALLIARLPRGQKPPPPLVLPTLTRDVGAPAPVPEESEPARLAIHRNVVLDRSVWEAARNGRPGAAERLISKTRGLWPAYESQLRGEAGQILFTLNRDAEAHDVAARGAYACGRAAPDTCQNAAIAGYSAGLAAWRMGRPDLARPLFGAAWRAALTTSALRAGAAFWAARAHLRTNDPAAYVPWMTRAATEQRTFYGFLARRTLGLGPGGALDARENREMLGLADLEAITAHPAGVRAFALLQIGQTTRAEAELRLLWPEAEGDPALGRAIMLVAENAGLAELAAQLADVVQTADGRPRDATRFPIPRLRPDGGFKIDPAMVYGLARTESNFNPGLVSSAGARGLMQIMPETASFILRSNAASNLAVSLHDPEFNLDLGQRYVAYLATNDLVDNDLLRLLACYNAGPGNFARWGAGVRDDGDPLLFIEAIPIDETRAFVPRVLTYTWIYATRLRLPMPSLDELAAGAWPRYHPRQNLQEPPARLH